MPARFESVNTPIAREPTAPNGGMRYAMDDDIVISGISGRLPESANLEEFKENLFNGVDMITEDDRRWTPGLYGMPARTGKLKDLSKFDAMFFGVHAKQADVMDPQLRILLELTQEAIIDAGINPDELRGSKTGVFVGVSDSESEEYWMADPDKIDGYGLTGCCRAMFPNRVSYTFDLTGPSMAVDTACSSSFYALHLAVQAMRVGQCDSAIVGGVNLVLKPTCSLEFHRLSMLSPDGMCKTFDSSGNGYVRAEAAVAILLQKSCDAKRVYATIVNSKTNVDGHKVQGITFPSGDMQNKLIREVYAEVGIDPADVSYVEAHGTGTKVGDPQEVNSIADVFCKNRKTPLLVGSVKSNMGHAEPASGVCSLAKMVIAMENGLLPGNLHYENPNPDIPALSDGRLQVVTKPTPWKGGLVAMNSFGFGGANAHILLRSHPKPKLSPVLNTEIPKLVAVSGRTEEAVDYLLGKIKEQENDDEFISLIHDIHKRNVSGHPYRGFKILGDSEVSEINECSSEKRPIWYVFSGMGSQWPGMGKQLWPIETFQNTLRRCHEALKPEGIDLLNVIFQEKSDAPENVLHNFISIAAIQVALVDVLTMVGIEPDGIVGHSVGELGCAYADGTFTAEQTVLAAYWRGKSIQETELLPGGMAAVGLSWEQATKRCPPNVSPACHNSADSVTISGAREPLNKFLEELKSEGVFAKLVNSAGIAFHSKFIASAGPKLRTVLERIIPNPKQRSSRWISSSIPESAWGTPLAQLSSPAYHVNNLLSPVLFQEAVTHVPDNAIVIEIAPHCLLQAILRRSLPPTVTNVGLHKRDHKNNLEFLLTNIGKLFNAGAQPLISKLYPPVSYPVGRGTAMLNSLIKWDHSMPWKVADFSGRTVGSGETVIDVDLSSEEYAHIAGHTIDGRILFPATGYLTLAWKTFAKIRGVEYEKLPVIIEDVQFVRATIMPKEGAVKFLVNIFEGTGDFEICEGGTAAVIGKIRLAENIEKDQLTLPIPTVKNEPELLPLTTSDVYKDLRLRGYDYNGIFRGIQTADNRGRVGRLSWIGNWTSFMDTMLQFTILRQDTRDLFLPTRLQYVAINPLAHLELASNLMKDEGIHVYTYPNINVIKSGGVEFREMKSSIAPRRQQAQAAPKHERYVFVPYENSQVLVEDPEKAKSHAITVLLQTVIENLGVLKLKTVEVSGERNAEGLLAPLIVETLLSEPSLSVDMQIATVTPDNYTALAEQWDLKVVARDTRKVAAGQDLQLVIAADVLSNNETALLTNLAASLKPGGYILLEETGKIDKSILHNTGLLFVAKQVAPGKCYVLLKQEEETTEPIIIQITEKNFSWLEGVKAALKKSETEGHKVLLVSQGEELLGMIGLMTCIRREAGGMNARYVFIRDKKAPKFSLSKPVYAEQLDKQLMANVLMGGQWGSYRHLRLDQQNDVSALQVEHAYINTLTRGDLSSLRWIESSLSYYRPERNPGKEFCHVYYSALNFRDIMMATGKLTADTIPGEMATRDCVLGFEFSGRNTKGRRVMGIVAAHGLATSVLADPVFMWEVPDDWSLEQAATVPICYATSYDALIIRGHMRPGETILIHAGSGGVGQASISIALHAGCTVFTTVGSQEKRDFLKKTFPQLTDRHIGCSRDTSFEQLILEETNGKGVDLVLNSLAGDLLQASTRCLAVHGRFLEIGKFDLQNNTRLGMSFFIKNTSFHGVLLDSFFESDTWEKREIVRLVNEGIKNGAVKPLPATVFSEQQIEQGFRYMATGKHIGKIVFKIREEESRKSETPKLKTVAAIPRTYMNPDKSYVLVGGLGGFGLELANWIVSRGAKNIILTSRSGVRTGYQALTIRRWRQWGINVHVSTVDVTTIAGAEQLLKESTKIAPIGGIFNLAAVLKDALIENQEEAHFKAVTLPKIDATKCLDTASRKLCPSLDYFVVFSSVSCGRGNMGQTNYGLANSAMERIVEQRQANGLPGLAIQWGAIGDVGLILETMGDNDTEIGGTLPQRMSSCLATMDSFLQQPHPVLACMVLADKHKPGDGSQVGLLEAVGHIMGIKDVKTINPNHSLADLGMDSLMGTEIKQTLERNYDLVLSAQEIRNLSFGKLLELSAGGAQADAPTDPGSPKRSIVPGSPSKELDGFMFRSDDSELIPRKVLVKMETKGKNGDPMFLIHPIDGTVTSMNGLAIEIDRPIWGLQCVKDVPLESMEELAAYYVKQIKTIKKNGPYSLIGYSFGACVAFEIALQLEAAGESVTLNLIDGSPEYITLHSQIISKQASEISSEMTSDGKRMALGFFVRQFNSNISFAKAYNVLKEVETDEAMLNKMVELIEDAPFEAEQLKIAAMLFYKKLVTANFYTPGSKFQGPITLFKAKDNFVALDSCYGLSKISTQNVKVIELSGNHRSIATGESVKEIARIISG